MDYHQNELDSNGSIINNNNKKWRCELCTYENWPSATKCTICQTLRSKIQQQQPQPQPQPQQQQQQHDNNNNIDDIYKIGTLIINNSNQQQQQQIIEKIKWKCTTCTYLNWPKSKNCIQCKTIRPLQTPPQTTRTSPTPISSSNKNNNSNNSPVISPSINKKHQQQQQQQTDLKKWSCKTCTYQNWPKTPRCVMCATLKPTQTQQSQQTNIPLTEIDRLFLAACKGVYENDLTYLNKYISSGADLARYLTQDECKLLNSSIIINNNNKTTNENNIFHVGLTLIHLCYQYKHKDELMKLLNRNSKIKKQLIKHYQQTARYPSPTTIYKIKFSPCQSCPSLATNIIERHITSNIRQRKFDLIINTNNNNSSSNNNSGNNNTNASNIGATAVAAAATSIASNLIDNNETLLSLPNTLCYYITDCHTFILPNEIDYEFIPKIKKILFDNLFDYDVQYELEFENKAINWCNELSKRLNSKLYALWNRHSGDCLLDSVLQACYGVFDKDNRLRQLMYECLEINSFYLKTRWKEHERLMAKTYQINYTIDDLQLEQDWQTILQLANTPGSSLEQAHIFALCHILRRPIIIYSIKYVKNNRRENIGLTHFEGVYLPLLWEANFCFKSPIVLGYTRGHFTALVPIENNYINLNNGIINNNNNSNMNVNETATCIGGVGVGGNNSSSNISASCSNNGCLSGSNNGNNNNNTTNNNNNNNNNNNASAVAGAIGGVGCCGGGGGGLLNDNFIEQVFYLPLTNHEGQLLPVHFLTESEIGREYVFLRQYLQLDRILSPSNNFNILVAQLRVSKRSMLVKQMLDEWLNYYRTMQLREHQNNPIIQQQQKLHQHQIINDTNIVVDDDEDDDDDDDEDDEDDDDDDDDDDENNVNNDEFVVDVES